MCRKKLIFLGITGALLIVTSGCSGNAETSTPDVINMADYPKLTSATELAEDAKNALSKEYDNLTTNCSAPSADSFPDIYKRLDFNYQMYSKEESKEKLHELLSVWEIDYSDSDISVYDYTAEECGEDVLPLFKTTYEKDNYQIGSGGNGPWSFSSSTFTTLKMGQDDFVKRYRISDSTVIPTDSYSIDGVDYSISDAIALSEEYFSKLADLIPADEVRPRTVIVFQPKDQEISPEIKPGEYVYLLYFELIKDGLPLNQNCEMWSPDIPFFRSAYISVEITKAGEISRVDANFLLSITSETEYGDGIFPLSYALDSANSTLAKYSDYVVSAVELDYTTLTWQWDKTTFYYEPWWCIRVAESKRIETGHGLDPVTVVYVNAITGETYLQSNIYGSEVGMEQYLVNIEDQPDGSGRKWIKMNGG